MGMPSRRRGCLIPIHALWARWILPGAEKLLCIPFAKTVRTISGCRHSMALGATRSQTSWLIRSSSFSFLLTAKISGFSGHTMNPTSYCCAIPAHSANSTPTLQKTGFEEITIHALERDFWPGMTSGLSAIQAQPQEVAVNRQQTSSLLREDD